MNLIIKSLFALILLCLGCNNANNNDQKAEVCINSKYIVDIWFGNRHINSPAISTLIEGRSDEKFLKNFMEMAATIDSLQMIYIHESGGFYPEGGIAKPGRKGNDGYRIYKEYKLPNKVDKFLSISQNDSSKICKKLNYSMALIMKENITENKNLNNQDYLSTTPYSLISLELSLIENQIYTLLISHIAENKKGN